ncbi:MAG: M48 family metallopeptidase [Proteobacteria bacterium]|nr:M48 family metallopeptidase [Pseudomonadota bacterium]
MPRLLSLSLLPGLAGLLLLGGCAGAVHRLPQVDSGQLGLAQSEVQAQAGAPTRRSVSDDEVMETVTKAIARIKPAATQVCHEMNAGVCTWTFRLSSDRSLNASARPNGLIVVNRGIVEYAQSEDEVAMVIAHEIGHQAANHLVTSQRNQAVGALVGAVLLGALGVAASSAANDRSGVLARQGVQSGATAGAAVGRISYSKEQEREADYIAALILYRSGMDLDKARSFLLTMARASGRRETGMLDTHPAGPERLAAWDRAVAEVRATNGRLPQRS